MKQIYIESYFKGYKKLCGYSFLKDHPKRKEIEKRLKIIKFFDTYGTRPTTEAFGVSRSTVFLWKQKLKKSKGRIDVLASASKVPKKRRTRETGKLIIDFIKDYRNNYPGIGKETIKIELDRYCQELSLKSVSVSTVGRIIKDLKEKGLIEQGKKLSFYAKSARLIEKNKGNQKKERRKGYRPKEGGDLVQVDSIFIFTNGLKRYILSAIDISTGFGFAFTYPSLSSLNATDFIKRFREVAPFNIKRVQTDNGSEFSGYFKDYMKKENITHFYNYPRYPKGNAFVERFNRTLKEQFINWHKMELYDVDAFNREFMNYLIWYNTKKPHMRLNKLPPLRYYLDCLFSDHKKSNMLWTLT